MAVLNLGWIRRRFAPRTLRPGLSIVDTAPDGQEGVAYSYQFQASGGTEPYTWSLFSGSLPAGLNLTSGGLLSGTPTTAETQVFVVQVQDFNTVTATREISITIAAAQSQTDRTIMGVMGIAQRKAA